MQRKKLILVVAATLGVLSVAVGALALARGPSAAASAAQAADGTGPHGGQIVADGPLSVEIVLSEKPGDARLIVYPSLDGKPAPKGAHVTGVLTRYDGARVPLAFNDAGGTFTTAQPVAAPHVFDSAITVKAGGRTATFPFSRADGAIALNAQQVGAAGIETARAGPASIATSFQLPGEIKFNEDRTAHVVPRVAGIVERVAVSIGQRVEQGQLLAVIASTDLADRRSELLSAERRLQAARTSYARERTLWEERISAEQDYLQAQVQLREAEIATQNARQKLAALNAPASASALNRFELRAPFAGTIVEKHLAPGEAVAADANVFVVSDLATVWAELAVPAQRLNDVRVGRDAVVSAAAFDSKAGGRIAYVGALLGEQTRTAAARIVLANPDGAWRPGMFVNVSVDAGRQDAPVAIANDALQQIDGASSVFVRSSKGFVAQPVETGRRDGQVVEILAGLKPGQEYVTTNSFVLKAELGKGSADEH